MKTRALFTILAATALTFSSTVSAARESELFAEQRLSATPELTTEEEQAPDTTKTKRPITPQQKAVARQMTQQGAKMAKKGVQLAVTAVADPSKADKLGDELEAMGDEMERLGDSLAALSEDTTFFYEGDEDSLEAVISDADFDDLVSDLADDNPFLKTLMGFFGGSLGLLGGAFGLMVGILALVVVFGVLTAPIWIMAILLILVLRNRRRNDPPVGGPRPDPAVGGTGGATSPTSYYVTENQDMWRSGVMYCCVGIGLAIMFFAIGFDSLWGVGALIACIGVAKLVIATTTRKNDTASRPDATPGNHPADSGNADMNGTSVTTDTTDNYSK